MFYAGTDDLSHSGAYEEFIPGTNFISYTLLPPGTHELEVRAPHFQPVTVSVEIRRDERTEVRVPLHY